MASTSNVVDKTIDDAGIENLTDMPVDDKEEEKPPVSNINVTVSKDKLYAYLTISQDPPVPYQITINDIYDALGNVGVEYGLMGEKLDKIISGKEYPIEELVAVGQEMVPGVDGELEYLISQEGSGPTDMGYYVDYRNLNLVENITAGQVLVRKIPAQPGEPGTSVFGKPLFPPRVKDKRLPKGQGTEISEDNPNELVASIDGFVRLDTRSFNKVVVEDVFKVNGDVDLSTGNLDIEGWVVVQGTVRTGFSVKASGNVKVLGRVEPGSSIEAGGSIYVSGGIIGGRIGAVAKANDNIAVKFADNASMTAGNSITVVDEAINCDLHADNTITVQGQGQSKSAGAIIGGQISAGQEIRATDVGTIYGILTRLRIGEQPGLIARRKAMQVDIKKSQAKIRELQTTGAALTRRKEKRQASKAVRDRQQWVLENQLAEYRQHIRTMLNQAEIDGYVTSTAQIGSLEKQIGEAKGTLTRIDSSIETLNKRLQTRGNLSETMRNRQTLNQFKAARENLINKLSDLENQQAQRSANPWGDLPWATRRELKQIQISIKNIGSQLNSIEVENKTDRKIDEALGQLHSQLETAKNDLLAQQEELDSIVHKIETISNKIPQVVVSGNLYGGTEVMIHQHRHTFLQRQTSVKVRFDKENRTVVAVSIN